MTYSLEIVERIKAKHGLTGDAEIMPFTGMVNEAWAIGEEFVLRINMREECDDEAKREALVVPAVRAAGVRTPELLVCDYDLDIVLRPYTIYRRAPGALLGNLEVDPASLPELYRELGREIALLGHVQPPEGMRLPGLLWSAWDVDKQIAQSLEAGVLAEEEASEIHALLKHMQDIGGLSESRSLIHKDIHPWNLMVDPKTFDLTAILDWGDTSIGDPATEFAAMPLVAVPSMFQGYEDAGEAVDVPFIARSLRTGIGLAIWEIRDADMQSYRRQWWRMPLGGWPEIKRFVVEVWPELSPGN